MINTAEFARCIAAALEKTAESADIVTLGIKPSRPETGYGYIAAKGKADNRGIYEVEAFKEKPDKETALKYVAAGNFFWNAGIFVWNVETLPSHPDVCTADSRSNGRTGTCLFTDKEQEELKRLFPTCEKFQLTMPSWKRRKKLTY